MTILFRYISVNFLRLFLICIMSFLFVYLSIDAMGMFWKLSERGVAMDNIARYFIFKIPMILSQVTPMATLLATLLTLGLLSRNSEVTVIKACGISIYYISIPILILSFGISLFALFSNEYMVPYANKQFKEIERYRPGRSNTQKLYKSDKIWYFGKKSIYNIDLLDSHEKTLRGVSIFRMNEDFTINKRIDAETAEWKDNNWVLNQGVIRDFTGDFGIEVFDRKVITLGEKFSDFKVVSQEPEEMTYQELKRFIKKLRRMGLDDTEYIVDLLAKIAFPLANFILPLIGIPFALKTGRSSGIAAGVGMSIVIGFTYWVTMTFNVSLGHVGVLPPFLAAFGSNIIFGLIGVLAVMNVKT